MYEEAQMYEETKKPSTLSLTTLRYILGGYLVSLALTGGDEGVKKIKELLKDYGWLLYADKKVSVPTRLMLKALLGPRGELSSELGGGLVVAPRELMEAFKDEILRGFLPALRVTFGLVKPEDAAEECKSIKNSTEMRNCIDVVSAAKGEVAAVEGLRRWLIINGFPKSISSRLSLFKELGVNVEKLTDEFTELVGGLDEKSLVQLPACRSSMAQLVLMLYALINGDEKLVKAHALMGAVQFSAKLTTRLVLDVYRAYEEGCNLSNEDLRQAVTKLFLFHI